MKKPAIILSNPPPSVHPSPESRLPLL